MANVTLKQYVELEAFKEGRNGYVRHVGRWRNLTTDTAIQGLAALTGYWNTSYTGALYAFRLGTGLADLKRNGGGVTFSRSGNVITASAAFFEAADAGRVIVCTGTGELRISSFTDSTHVVVSTAGADFAGASGTVYYVTRTGLATPGPLAAFNEVAVNDIGTRHGYTFDAGTGTLTSWVTRISGVSAADTLYREICWQTNNGALVLGIANINGGVGDTLLVGERYRVKVTTVRQFGPITPTAAADLPVTGISGITAQWQLESVPASYWNSSGADAAIGDTSAEIYGATRTVILSDSVAALRAPVFGDASFIGTAKASTVPVIQTYVAGTNYREWLATFAANTAAFSGVRSIMFGGNSSYSRCMLRGLLSAPIGKLLEEKLELRFRITLDRGLTP